jgi:hypothetical protein
MWPGLLIAASLNAIRPVRWLLVQVDIERGEAQRGCAVVGEVAQPERAGNACLEITKGPRHAGPLVIEPRQRGVGGKIEARFISPCA